MIFTEETSPTLKAARDGIRQNLKDMLEQCTDGQVLLFKRMYSPKNLEISISKVVDALPEDKIPWAVCQVENTLKKNKSREEQAACPSVPE